MSFSGRSFDAARGEQPRLLDEEALKRRDRGFPGDGRGLSRFPERNLLTSASGRCGTEQRGETEGSESED